MNLKNKRGLNFTFAISKKIPLGNNPKTKNAHKNGIAKTGLNLQDKEKKERKIKIGIKFAKFSFRFKIAFAGIPGAPKRKMSVL